MDLKDYIADVISQTIEGVQLAQKRFNPDARVLPPVISPTCYDSKNQVKTGDIWRRPTLLNFDIEVAAERKDAKGANAGFSISVAGVGAKTDSSRRDNAINRLSFQIVIVLPEISSL